MTEQRDERVDRVDQRDERVDDLEVTGTEARDIAGGKHRPKAMKVKSRDAAVRYNTKET